MGMKSIELLEEIYPFSVSKSLHQLNSLRLSDHGPGWRTLQSYSMPIQFIFLKQSHRSPSKLLLLGTYLLLR